MQVSYHHANPHSGRESVLLRFYDEIHDQTTCILIDSGNGVDVDELLGDDEYLSAILLTHAHLDHYRTLGSNLRDQATIYATRETAAAIETRLQTNADHDDLDLSGDVRDALEPIVDWTEISPNVRIHPVPAGHAPGASGFVIQFDDGEDSYNLLASGDFTTRRAAGYPGLATEIPIDAVFLTVASNAEFPDQLTGAVETIVQRAHAGSTVLATASGTTGVHLAYLLDSLSQTTDRSIPVTVAGRVATVWDTLEYDRSTVEAVSVFDDPADVLQPGSVTIAGPEVPIAGSSKRLFEAMRDDGGATLIQVTSGAFDEIDSASCTVHEYELSNHPDEATIDAVVEEYEPIHVVVTHAQGRAARKYKDRYNSFVWAPNDDDQYTLYDEGWEGPPWVNDATHRRVMSRQYTQTDAMGQVMGSIDVGLPTVERLEDVDLEAEGLDTDRLDDALHRDVDGSAPAPEGDPADESAQTVSSSPGDAEEASQTDVVAADGSTAVDREESQEPTQDQSASLPSSIEEAADAIDAEAYGDILERLDRIEAAVTGTTTTATVVDAGDGVMLLRLTDDSIAEDLEHGQTIEIAVQTDDEPAIREEDETEP
ncbi:MBL fold metallo-hydrolase [Halococcoides cellulosivorans]|uniref:MBL fold metallo-hydrolase n=1 Tax=Halococcoides cellulosivorans TaxID=1679096 RepID=A0A2R4X3R8_9EURY|nr:MBL fold metallo-hydrolase [Halococcoides cellulosivorans]AWB28440.1 MBL fold metallo-hydrolase [Halococcoides cellulosivorans]